MAASGTKESMMLCYTVTVNGQSLCSYEDVRNFVKTINPRFYDTFGQPFPTSLAFDKYDYIAKFFSVDEREKAFDFYRSQYNLDVFGAMMCSVLRSCTNDSPARSISKDSPGRTSDDEMSDVYSLSIEALITKVESDTSDFIDQSTVLREAFSLPYIDPHDYVGKIVKRLMKNMDDYDSKSGNYVAPYTSLVTSSMMGKSRLMRELAQHVPLVYICLRQTADEGQFPPATMYLRDWIKEGACVSIGAKVTDLDIASDNHNIIATLRYSLFLLHMIFKLGVLIDEFGLPAKHLEIKAALPTSSYVKSYAWLWDFFADPRPVFATPCQEFWEAVQADTVTEFRNLRRASAKGKNSPTTCKWASTYLTTTYPDRVTEAHHNLQNSFRRLMGRRNGREQATLIVCFDEARFLCDTSALTKVEVRSRHNRTSLESMEKVDTGMSNVLYSNFRALRRALRFLKQGQLFVPRVFGLFTDTTSRLTTNFQLEPREKEESTGRRVLELPSAGANQFDPVYIFTSIDAHSQIMENNLAISDHRQVAKVERLLKFGRAGWYSIYSASNSATSESMSMNPTYNKKSLLDIATGKLLGCLRQPAVSINQLVTNHEDATSKWLALLACRLAISVGPFSREAEELVSSHLAVLLRADQDLLKIYYPSEPILAEASASITHRTGWKPALKALHNHLQNGIIIAGYWGKLLSKLLCLIAMDSITKPLPCMLRLIIGNIPNQ
jgi:hypothetical protein